MRPPWWRLAALLLAASCEDTERPVGATPPYMEDPDISVAPEALACPGFELQGDRVKDLSTGLVWDRFVALSLRTHDEAARLCADRGGRLPTRPELMALRAPGDACQLPACPFLGDRCATLQCGTAIAGTDAHWGVAFSGGALVMVPGGGAEALLCVR